MDLVCADVEAIAALWRAWGGFIVSTGRILRPEDVEGILVRRPSGETSALATWRVDGEAAEIVTLDAFPPGRGLGSIALAAAERALEARGVRRVRLLTTSDNVRALAFYVRHGYRLVRVHLDFMDRVRRYKPGLPLAGGSGIARRDAWELDKPLPGAVRVRPEAAGDAPGIRRLLVAAFETPAEADLVGALRGSTDEIVSLVALAGDEVVGHVLFSRARLEGVPVAALAPLAVREDRRRLGLGDRLVREGLERCRAAGERIAVVLGDPAYYGRFGFAAASAIGCEYPAPPGCFQVLALAAGAIDGLAGTVRYAEAFSRFSV